jgi:uncharacterized Tic20 family protein
LNGTPQTTTLEPPPPSQDERTMATLAHALQIVGSWIAPLIIFLIKRNSRFVSFHALQALLLQIVHLIVVVLFVVGFAVLMFFGIFLHAAAGSRPAEPPVAVFFLFPLVWLFMFASGITILIIAIVYCIKAGRGEWAEYPVLGRLARRILKIEPGGTNQF